MTNESIFDYQVLWTKLKGYALSIGRIAAKPVLLLYYVMMSNETPWKDKAAIFGALAYVILPVDLLDAKRLPILGWLDEVASLAVAIKQMSKYVTPEMEIRAEAQLNAWFGDVVEVKEVTAYEMNDE